MPGSLAFRLVAFVFTLLTVGGIPAFAQPSPDQGRVDEFLRQQAREQQLREQQERGQDVRLPNVETPQGAEHLSSNTSACINIKKITLVGDSASTFQWALKAASYTADHVEDKATDRCLDSRSVNVVMGRIQNAVIARGFVAARVLAGPQAHLAQGTLELTLFPGRIRHIRFAPGTNSRATLWNAMPLKPGQLLNLRDIEQALENFKRLPTVDADIQIVPAEGSDAQPGQSDLLIQWRQGFPVRLSVSVDDSGTRDTGKYQGSVTVSYDHLLRLNDLFYVSLNHDLGGGDTGARGTRGYAAHYSVPFDYWLLGFTTSQNQYHQSIAGASQTYLYSGESQNSEVQLSRLIYRDAVRKTSVSLKGWTRASKNYIDDTEIEVQRRRMAGFGIGVSHREFIGRATLDGSLNYRRGTGAWDALPAPEEAFGEGTSRPQILIADAQFTTPFQVKAQHLRYTLAWRAQWNKTPLVPQDRFAIGTRYTVRGFDGENMLLAERGWFVRNDLGLALGQSGQELYIGLDYGQVSGPSSEALIGTYLSGAVLGLRGAYRSVSYDVFIGRPLRKPQGFRTANSVAGFYASWSL